jgi:hypothetical protein
MDRFTNIGFIYDILNIIDLIDDVLCGTFVSSTAGQHMRRDLIKLINTLYHPERIG